MRNTLSAIILISMSLFSCEKETEEWIVDTGNPIVGSWSHESYEEDIWILKRVSGLEDMENGGFSFYSDGLMVERANSGFCGTPPIAYTNYEGTWNLPESSLIDVTRESWWDEAYSFQIEIVNLSDTEMEIRFIWPDWNDQSHDD